MRPLVRFESLYEKEIWQSELASWNPTISVNLRLTEESLILNTSQVLGKAEIYQSRLQLQEDLFEGPYFHCIDLLSRSIDVSSHLFNLTNKNPAIEPHTFYSDQFDICHYLRDRFHMKLTSPEKAAWIIVKGAWELPHCPHSKQTVILFKPKLLTWKDPRLYFCKSVLLPVGIHLHEAVAHVLTQGDSAFGFGQYDSDVNIRTSVARQEPDERTLFELVRLTTQWSVLEANPQQHLDWTVPAEKLLSHLQSRFSRVSRFDLVLYFHTLELRLQSRLTQLDDWVDRWRQLLQNVKFGENHPDVLKLLFEVQGNVRSWEDSEEMGEKIFSDRTDDLSHHQIKRISESLFYWKQKVQFEVRLLQSLQSSLEDTYESQI